MRPRQTDWMSNTDFKLMKLTFDVIDFIYPHYIDKRVVAFGIRPGMIVVDYGCGPGRYTVRFARLVGEGGKVIAVDVQELALEEVNHRATRLGLKNVQTALARGYDSGLPDRVADVVCAIDMFFSARQPAVFLKELHRITKPEGMLVLDDGHQRRATTKEKLLSSGYWQIVEETRDHLKCKPVPFTKGFSKREDEVIELLLQGKSNKQIALALGISEHTVEFHLNNVYTKLQVGSRTEAILKLGKSTGGTLREKPGESPVDNGGKKTDNIGSSTWQRIKKMGGCLVKPMVFISMAVLLAALAIYLLTRPAVWKVYTRECEFVDEHTVGQVIARSKASGAKVLGQFGSTSEVPWPAKSGYVVYKAINLPQVDQLFLKLQYSKNSPTTNPILIFIDDEATPRASIFLPDQHSWDQFTMSEPILLGSIKSGIHTIKFVTEGQQFGVADLDKFILAGNSP